MAIYAIGDLHLSFGTNKPMDIFGYNWDKHDQKIKKSWMEKVKDNDTVLLLGDFSWAMYLEETFEDFKYLCSMPGKKIMLKGNHDYWWSTLAKMHSYLKNNEFENIDFIQNNSFLLENKIVCGTRGWVNVNNKENYPILRRENLRLEMSIQDGIKKYGDDKEIIICMHYPPFNKEKYIPDEINFVKTMQKYNVKYCLYGHLHGEAHRDAIEGNIDGIEYKLLSSDYKNFELTQIYE